MAFEESILLETNVATSEKKASGFSAEAFWASTPSELELERAQEPGLKVVGLILNETARQAQALIYLMLTTSYFYFNHF